MTALIAAVRDAEEAMRQAQADLSEAKEQRRRAVKAMSDAGLSYRQIAAHLGITYGRVGQILSP